MCFLWWRLEMNSIFPNGLRKRIHPNQLSKIYSFSFIWVVWELTTLKRIKAVS